MGFKITKNTFNNKVVEAMVKGAIGLYGDTAAKRMEADAKAHKPWTNRTGNAVNSILGSFSWKGDHARIEISGNVDYFVWLELAHEKRFAILVPTIQKDAPEVLKNYRRIF